MLLGRLAPDEGRAALGSGVVVGEVDQARGLLSGGTSLLDVFSREPELDRWPTAEIRTLLAKFGLGSEHVHRGADTLSPGERTRAALALLQARGVNLLVLDEPTNHLDLTAIEQLETALASFEGTLLLVSHDRRLLAGVATTRGWHLDAGRVVEVDRRGMRALHPGVTHGSPTPRRVAAWLDRRSPPPCCSPALAVGATACDTAGDHCPRRSRCRRSRRRAGPARRPGRRRLRGPAARRGAGGRG